MFFIGQRRKYRAPFEQTNFVIFFFTILFQLFAGSGWRRYRNVMPDSILCSVHHHSNAKKFGLKFVSYGRCVAVMCQHELAILESIRAFVDLLNRNDTGSSCWHQQQQQQRTEFFLFFFCLSRRFHTVSLDLHIYGVNCWQRHFALILIISLWLFFFFICPHRVSGSSESSHSYKWPMASHSIVWHDLTQSLAALR